MKIGKGLKIVLLISLIINIGVITIQLIGRKQQVGTWERNIKMKYETRTKTVNISETKNQFLDSLYNKYPELKSKKYLFINIWDTGDGYSIKQLPMLDTLVEPLIPTMGYILVNDEKADYAARILKQDKGETKNFVSMNNCEDFIYAVNQELAIPRSRWRYPHCPMNLILDNKGKILYHDTLESLSGPKWPEDSLKDKKFVAELHKAFNKYK